MKGRHLDTYSRPARRNPRAFPPIFWAGVIAAAVVYAAISSGRDLMIVVVVLVVVAIGLLVWQGSRRSSQPLSRRAGLVLDGLNDAGFVTLHDLRLDHRRFDYVVVGPPGVYVARVELPQSDGISLRQPKGADIGDSLTELHEDVVCLSRHVKPPVKPLLVTAAELEVEVLENGHIVSIASLEPYLRNQRPQLKDQLVRETVAEVLRAATAGPSSDQGEEKGVSSA